MTAVAALFYAIALIAIAAILCAMYLLVQRTKLRDRVTELEFRERKLSDHCVMLLHSKRKAEAERDAANRIAMPRYFGPTRGVA